MSKTIINVYRLTKKFGNVNAVNDISFDVGQGATVGLLGGNGAGKTTTLGMLLGLLLPSSGAIKIFGEDMVNNRHRVLPWMNFSSPYVDLPHRLTVRENLTVYGHLYGLPKVQERVKALAHDFNLTSFLVFGSIKYVSPIYPAPEPTKNGRKLGKNTKISFS